MRFLMAFLLSPSAGTGTSQLHQRLLYIHITVSLCTTLCLCLQELEARQLQPFLR